MKHTKQDLKEMQAWPLERKIQVTQTRIIEWYQYFNGQVYLSFSGGKDSTVLLDLARRIYPDISAVFVDTGLEYPEVREFVKTFDNVEWLRPEKTFDKVIAEYGYPVISKEISKIIYGVFHGKTEKSRRNYLNRINGLNPDGTVSTYKMQRYHRWKYLLDAPFKISNRCCWFIKEKPCIQFERRTKKKPIVATMAVESQQRKDGWLKTGCNSFDEKKTYKNGKLKIVRQISKPISFWTEQDVLKYLYLTKLPIAKVYGDIITVDSQMNLFNEIGILQTTGEQRTGCMFCMFGCHLDKVNRFQRMKITHPKLYDYCINKLGCGEVLDFVRVRY